MKKTLLLAPIMLAGCVVSPEAADEVAILSLAGVLLLSVGAALAYAWVWGNDW